VWEIGINRGVRFRKTGAQSEKRDFSLLSLSPFRGAYLAQELILYCLVV
jgi:hypothetical protein